LTDDQIRADYDAERAIIRPVQEGQKKLLRWLVKYHGVKRVWVEGLTDCRSRSEREPLSRANLDRECRLPGGVTREQPRMRANEHCNA
jgi:hypothetical protein